MSSDPNQGRATPPPAPGAKPGAAAPPAGPAPGQQPPAGAAPPEPAAAQRVDDTPQAEPISLDNPDDFTFGDTDQPVPADAPGIPQEQWNPEITGDSADFVPDPDDQPIQYAEPGDDPAREQIRQTILARRGDQAGAGG